MQELPLERLQLDNLGAYLHLAMKLEGSLRRICGAFGVTVRAVIGFLAHNQGSFVAAFESASFTDVGIAHGFESRLGSPCGSNAEILSEFDGTVKLASSKT